jgi:hypothetical protein
MKTRIVIIAVLLLAAFTLMLLFATQTSAKGQLSPLQIPYQQTTPTTTIPPTQIFTVTVIVTVTAIPTETPIPTPTLEPTIPATVTVIVTATPAPSTPTPTATPIPLPPNAPAILADIEADWLTHWNTIAQLQLEFYFLNGRPWQGLLTHSTIPADGNSAPADRLLSHPTDLTQNWIDFYSGIPTSLHYAVRIDTYDGFGGRGFVSHLYVTVAGDLWHRAIDYGGGGWTEQWSIAEPLP